MILFRQWLVVKVATNCSATVYRFLVAIDVYKSEVFGAFSLLISGSGSCSPMLLKSADFRSIVDIVD